MFLNDHLETIIDKFFVEKQEDENLIYKKIELKDEFIYFHR